MRRFATIADVVKARGEDLGLTDWVHVDQARIQLFADATGDHNWIHVDPARAAQSRYGGRWARLPHPGPDRPVLAVAAGHR